MYRSQQIYERNLSAYSAEVVSARAVRCSCGTCERCVLIAVLNGVLSSLSCAQGFVLLGGITDCCYWQPAGCCSTDVHASLLGSEIHTVIGAYNMVGFVKARANSGCFYTFFPIIRNRGALNGWNYASIVRCCAVLSVIKTLIIQKWMNVEVDSIHGQTTLHHGHPETDERYYQT